MTDKQQAPDERERFEAHVTQFMDPARVSDHMRRSEGDDGYEEWGVALAWESWRAALATPPAAPEREAAEPVAWRPIETAPKDGDYILVSNGFGVWVAYWQPAAVSGYRFDDPWRSVMLNHWHIKSKEGQYRPAAHWMPLPSAQIAATTPVEREALAAEVARLTECLKRANDQAEHFERQWYLRGDELDRLAAAAPDATAGGPHG